jgi:hypothetical protein
MTKDAVLSSIYLFSHKIRRHSGSLEKILDWDQFRYRRWLKKTAAKEDSVVVPVAGARVCLDCDVIYSAPYSCPRCHGDAYLELTSVLPAMFKPGEKQEIGKVIKLKKVKRNHDTREE